MPRWEATVEDYPSTTTAQMVPDIYGPRNNGLSLSLLRPFRVHVPTCSTNSNLVSLDIGWGPSVYKCVGVLTKRTRVAVLCLSSPAMFAPATFVSLACIRICILCLHLSLTTQFQMAMEGRFLIQHFPKSMWDIPSLGRQIRCAFKVKPPFHIMNPRVSWVCDDGLCSLFKIIVRNKRGFPKMQAGEHAVWWLHLVWCGGSCARFFCCKSCQC